MFAFLIILIEYHVSGGLILPYRFLIIQSIVKFLETLQISFKYCLVGYKNFGCLKFVLVLKYGFAIIVAWSKQDNTFQHLGRRNEGKAESHLVKLRMSSWHYMHTKFIRITYNLLNVYPMQTFTECTFFRLHVGECSNGP